MTKVATVNPPSPSYTKGEKVVCGLALNQRMTIMHVWLLNRFLIDHSTKWQRSVLLCCLVLYPSIFHFSLSDSFARTINYRAAIVVDTSTEEILYANNPNRQLPPASTTKLMTAIVVIESKNLSDVVTISKNASLTPLPRWQDSKKVIK